jgi:hypothetical protein
MSTDKIGEGGFVTMMDEPLEQLAVGQPLRARSDCFAQMQENLAQYVGRHQVLVCEAAMPTVTISGRESDGCATLLS